METNYGTVFIIAIIVAIIQTKRKSILHGIFWFALIFTAYVAYVGIILSEKYAPICCTTYYEEDY